MLLARLLVVIAAIALAVLVGLWMLTGDRRYLGWAGRIGKVAGLCIAIIVLLLLAERLIVL